MQLYPDRLEAAVQKKLDSVYCLMGDDTVLVNDARSLIRLASVKKGYTEFAFEQTNATFDWSTLEHQFASGSLFASKRFLDIRLHSGAMQKKNVQQMALAWCKAQSKHVITVLTLPMLDAKARKTAWFRSLQKESTFVPIWPVDPKFFGRWVAERCRKAKLSLAQDALQLFVRYVEGNTLAVVQEIEKLTCLLAGKQHVITAEQLEAFMVDQSSNQVFAMVDAALQKQKPKALHMLKSLRHDQVHMLAIVGAFVSRVKHFQSLLLLDRTQRASRLSALPKMRQSVDQQIVSRLEYSTCLTLLDQLSDIDQQCKGVLLGCPWMHFERMILAFR